MNKKFSMLVLALLAIGLAVRLYGAWCFRFNLNSDASVVALMAKHMAEGRDFPVFFYGQAYMGSFEPMVSAVLYRLFGYSGFMVCLGTALLGFCTLPIIYRWACDLDTRTAGIAALAWCLVGPCGYFHYQVSPRGSYAATLFFGTLVLWLSARMIVRERQASPERFAQASQGDQQASPWYFLLGLLAGIGWWSNQLTTATLITAALLFALFMLPRLFGRRTLAAAAGFVLGSLPLWWWNATHQWTTFNFMGTFGQRTVWDGLGLFFLDRFPEILDLDSPTHWRNLIGVSIYIMATLITAGVMLNAGRKHRLAASVFGLMLFSFILVSALIFSTSRFAGMNSPRYLLPLVPVMAVMVGVMTARLQAWLPVALAWVAWLPLLFLISFQLPALQGFGKYARGKEAYQRQIESVGTFLRARGVEAAYIPYSIYAWNFALRETHCFSLLPMDRYPPYSRQAELADQIAVFGNEGDVAEFLNAYGGTARIDQMAGVCLHTAFAPPDFTPSILPVGTAERIVDSKGHDALALVTDRKLDTWWESDSVEGADEWVEIRFRKPERVGLVRLLCFPKYPPELQIEGLEPGGTWQPLTSVLPSSYYFWSGPRLYFGDWLYRVNIVFTPVTVEALRLRCIGAKFGIRELQWFAPAEPAVPDSQAFPELVNLIRERSINRLYCDRWVANALHRTCGQAIQVPLDPTFFEETTRRLGAEMRLTPHTGILARREDAGVCREVLSKRLVNARETTVGPWVLFDFEAAHWSDTQAGDLGLQWSGFACFMTRNKLRAATLVHRADAAYRNGNRSQAMDLLLQANRMYPNYHPVTDRLTWWLEADGRKNEAVAWRNQSAHLARPETNAEIRFHNGATFRGMTLSNCRVRPGETFIIRYYWQYPTKSFRNLPQVFVHFLGEHGLFQDDHPLPRLAGADDQPLPEIFMSSHTLRVPSDLAAGPYIVKIGLFRPEAHGKRIRADTDLPGEHGAFTLPVTIEVMAP